MILQNLQDLIARIDKKTSGFDSSMLDIAGNWLPDTYEIQADLGMPINEYESLINFKNDLQILIKHGIKEIDISNFSIHETAMILDLDLKD